MKKDLYIVFNGMFLFNWKKGGTLEVLVPMKEDHHNLIVAQSQELDESEDLPKGPLRIAALEGHKASTTPGYNNELDLVIPGSKIDIDYGATRRHAMLSLPWPEKAWSCQSHYVREDKYCNETPHFSVSRPGRVPANTDAEMHSGIAVSEVFVIRYSNVEAAKLTGGSTDIAAIDVRGGQAFGIFATENPNERKRHDDLFNRMLKHKTSGLSTKYSPTAKPAELDMPGPMLNQHYTADIAQALPQLWLIPQIVIPKFEFRSASGMGSCDNGHRCEEC